MRPTLALVLVVLAAACRGSDSVLPSEPSAADTRSAPRSPLLVDGDLHGLVPSDELIRAAMRLGNAADRALAVDEVEALPPAERVAVLRTGIRLRDTLAARTAASLLVWQEIDDWESALVTRLVADAVVDPAYRDERGGRPDFGSIFECASGEELPYILDRAVENAATIEDAGNLSILHKQASAEHLPALARAALSPQAELRRHALDMLMTVAMHTDRHREDVAAALLEIPVEELLRRHPDSGEGLPSALIAVLSLRELPFDPGSKFRNWRERWLADSRPAARDVEFLLGIAMSESSDVIAWVLREVGDVRIDEWLAAETQVEEGGNDQSSSVHLGVLAHRGRRDALARLAGRARSGSSESLAVILAIAPNEGRVVVEERVFGDDADAAFEMLDAVEDAWVDVPAWAGIAWDDRVFEGFAEAALARPLDGVRLATIGVSVPHCRTRALAAAAIAALPRDAPPNEESGHPLDLDGHEVAFLETAAPEAFRALVREWTNSPDEFVRHQALVLLARLGDPASGARLVDAVRRGDIDAAALARSPCPEVREFLRERGREDFAAAVAYGVTTGLPERVDLRWFVTEKDPPLAPDVVGEIRAMLLDGGWMDAVARALEAAPDRGAGDQGLEGAGLVDDPRVRAYLHRLQEQRELRLYQWATAELAILGEPAARSEYERALRIGRYRWGDETNQIAFHDGLRALPFWLDLLETNCCRFASIRSSVFDHWFGFKFQTEAGHGLSTPVAEARRFVARADGRFIWTRADDRYLGGWLVPAPR